MKERQYIKGTCNACQCFISWRSLWENIKNYWVCTRTFRDIWGNPDFTSERFLTQTNLARDELWRDKTNVAVRETRTSYETFLYSCIVLSIYEQLFLYFNFFVVPEWLYILLFEFKPVFNRTKMPNMETCLLHEFSHTHCIWIHRLCSRMIINHNIILIRNTFVFLCWYCQSWMILRDRFNNIV